MTRISKEFRFEASHILPKHPGKCSRLHGHSWRGWVTVEGPVDKETGFVVDYSLLKSLIMNHIEVVLDHTHLGQGTWAPIVVPNPNTMWFPTPPFGENFYPSSENLVVAIGKILQPLVRELAPDVRLFEVSLDETCTSRAIWRPEGDDSGRTV